MYERAIRLSPRHPWWVNAGYGLALHLAGRSKEAIEVYQKGIDTGTNDARLYARLAAAYADVGHLEEARQAAADAIKNDPQFTIDSYLQTYAFIDPEKTRWYKELLRQTGLPE